ncbi:MAG: metallophosphoesterase [Chitinophagales bacterium]
MKKFNFVRVKHPHLSLWQSVVSQHVREQLEQKQKKVRQNDLLAHPMVQATNDHVLKTFNGEIPNRDNLDLSDEHELHVYLSHLGYEWGNALAAQDTEKADLIGTTYRKYSDKDPNFAQCAVDYAKYYLKYNGIKKYNDWKTTGNNDLNYGVIQYQLPNNAKVAILGDWGTGLADAEELLLDIMQKHNPDAIIHLGDIYYSATPSEVDSNFAQIFRNVFAQAGRSVPVFTIPGNHDYYCMGYGYYSMVNQLNAGINGALQEASYFCLRTQDNGWQFLAMDTGYNDANPADQFNTFGTGPAVQSSELEWHQDKLENFNGATILLSHHQLFSCNAKINGSFSKYRSMQYMNPYLHAAFGEYYDTKIAAWLWGHEHNLALYQNDLFGLSKGRLIGCSAFEELQSANPYGIKYPEVPYQLDPANGLPYELGTNADPNGVGYYNHGYAVIDLGGRKNPSDVVQISYYEYPSWGNNAPANPASNFIMSEALGLPAASTRTKVLSNAPVHVYSMEGLCLTDHITSNQIISPHIFFFPTLGPDNPVDVNLFSLNGGINAVLRDGDAIYIQSLESGLYYSPNSHANYLFSDPSMHYAYYLQSNPNFEKWIIHKRDTSTGSQICYDDEVYFINFNSNEWLVPAWSKNTTDILLTTAPNADYYWQIKK